MKKNAISYRPKMRKLRVAYFEVGVLKVPLVFCFLLIFGSYAKIWPHSGSEEQNFPQVGAFLPLFW